MLNFTRTNTLNNQVSRKNSLLVKKLLELSDFSKQSVSDKKRVQSVSLPTKKETHSSLYYRSPLNLLFSIDQFFFEFAKKSPQRKKASEFKLQLKERKKLSLFYGSLSKKQISQMVNESFFFKGHDTKKILSLLEQRLDVTLYRSNFAKNITIARQYISHKKILVNNKCVTLPSYKLNPGDIISIVQQKLTKIGSIILEDIRKDVSKRNSIYLLEPSILKKWKQKKSILLKKDIDFFIGFLLKKIQSRTKIVISRDPFDENWHQNFFGEESSFFPLVDQKLIQKNTQYFCLFYENSQQKVIPHQNTLSTKESLITPKIKLVNTVNSLDFLVRNSTKSFFIKNDSSTFRTSPKLFAENRQVDFVKTKKISEYFQHQLLHIILGFHVKKISREFFILTLKKYLGKKLSKKQILNGLKIGGVKPLHLEISYKLLKFIVLYAPQRIYYPFLIDVDLIKRSYKK
jgi:ribosomal protein S4